MQTEQLTAYIGAVVDLTSSQLALVLSLFEPARHPKNTVLLRPGEVS